MALIDATSGLPTASELGRWALFLDIDGTLLDIAPLPDLVEVPVGLGDTLSVLLERLGGAVALISGRSIRQIDQLFAPLRIPAAGEHGGEIRCTACGPVRKAAELDLVGELRPFAAALARELPGVLPEYKSTTIAFHFRQVPEMGERLRERLEALVASHEGLTIQPGKMVLEVKPSGRDKGTAIREMMREKPFEGRRPVFLGDDATDEYGFAAVEEMGGLAIRVTPVPPSSRTLHFETPAQVRTWLTRLAGTPTTEADVA